MISLEVRVNGSLIAAASVVNRGAVVGGLYEYEAQTMLFPENNDGPPLARHFRFKHAREDGAMKLIREVVGKML